VSVQWKTIGTKAFTRTKDFGADGITTTIQNHKVLCSFFIATLIQEMVTGVHLHGSKVLAKAFIKDFTCELIQTLYSL